ncbi:MAG TPA: hypothetical protein VNU71_14630 [Burkholderiaceae bacterium]|nr:hypothetical protein [Burkholderiaceae bacterium]
MDAQAQALSVRRIAGADAARALAGMEALDPRGLCGPGDIEAMCERGQCFELAGAADAVYVLTVRNGIAWVDAAKGSGPLDLVAALHAIVTEQAEGLRAIALQTARRGMVEKLKRRGFRVTGWILRKELQ